MAIFPNESERRAAVNSVIQGDTRQLLHFLDQINDIDLRISKVEGGGSSGSSSYDDIEPVSVPGAEARASEVRDATIEIAGALNALIAKLKGQ